MQKKLIKYLSMVTVLLIVVTACSGEKKKTLLEVAPAFSLMGLDSVEYTLAGYEGEIIMLHFWADWCAHCRQEFPELQAAYDSLKGQGFNLVSINSGQTRDIAEGIRKTFDLSFPILMDPDKKVTEEYGVKGLPTSYFVDSDQRVLKRHIGWLKKSDIYETFSRIKSTYN